MAAIAAPALGFGPVGWAVGGAVAVGVLLFAAANNNNNNNGSIHDNHNGGNPNNRGPNGDPQFPFYYHEVRGRSRKDAYNRALNDSYGNQPINHGNHFHASRMRGGQLFKFGNTHYTW